MPKVIKDPLYGEINIEDEFLPVVDSPEFQRLRRISQLGLAKLVYPGATHSRFLHSLGAFHISKAFNDPLLSLYALLHDIGHPPFSHAVEDALNQLGIKFNHEERMFDIAEKILQNTTFTLQDLKRAVQNGVLVHGDLGVDRMDYLMRDSYFSGVKIGYIEWERLTRLMEAKKNRIEIDPKAIDATEHFFIARFLLGSAIYMHKTNLVAEKMLELAIKNLLEEVSWKEIVEMDENQLVCALKRSETEARKIWEMIERRNLFKMVYRSRARESAEEVYEKLAEELGENSVVMGRRASWHKRITVRLKDGRHIYEVSPLIRQLAEADRAKRYYFVAVHPEFLNRAIEILG